MPSVLTGIAPDPLAPRVPISLPEAEKPGLLETLGAAWRLAGDDAVAPIVNPVEDSWVELRNSYAQATGRSINVVGDWKADLWGKVQGLKADNPKMFGALPATREEWERGIMAPVIARHASDKEMLGRSEHGVAGFVGGMAGQTQDMLFWLTLPIGGGGKTVGQTILREAVVNAAVEAAQQPLVAQRREALNDTLTREEAITNVVGAGILGGLIGGGTHAVAKNWDAIRAAPREVQEKLWASILDRSPALRERLGAKIDWDALDSHLPDLAEANIGAERMTDDERAAVAGLRRETAVMERSPYTDDAAGRTAHLDALGAAMRRIMDQAPALPAPAPLAVPRARPVLGGSTAIASGVVPGDARSVVKARIGVVESGGSATAKNPRSSATGLYQFVGGTWLRLYKNRYGDGGLGDAAILAKRGDTRLQNVLMDDLMTLNTRALERAGVPPSAGNLYLAHFAGSGGATRLHGADPGASARSVLGDAVVEANPFLRTMNARDVIAWAERKMGGSGPVLRSGGDAVERGAADVLEDDIAALRAERDGIEQALGRMGTEDDPVFSPDAAEDIPLVKPELLDPAHAEPALSEAVRDALPALRQVVLDRDRSLNRTAELAQELGLSEDDLRAGLTRLAEEGQIVVRRDTGAFMRRPPAPERGPRSLLEWISDRGGIEDVGGDIAHMGGTAWHRGAPFRRKLIRAFDPQQASIFGPGGGARQHSLEGHFEAAISDGYFPELRGRLDQGGGADLAADKPDAGIFLAAIRDELDGTPRYALESGRGMDSDPVLREDPFAADEAESLGRFRTLWAEYGNAPDDLPESFLAEAARRWNEGEGLAPEHVVATMWREEYEDTLAQIVDEAIGEEYGTRYDIFNPDHAAEWQRRFDQLRDSADGARGDGRAAERGGPGAGGADGARAARGGEDAAGDVGLENGPIEPERYARFDDPHGPAAEAQATSVIHDVRASVEGSGLDLGDAVDPNVAARQRQEAQLGAEAPMRANVEQDGVMGLGLFDQADAPGFRFDEGEPMSAADMLKDLDEDAAMLQRMKDCLK